MTLNNPEIYSIEQGAVMGVLIYIAFEHDHVNSRYWNRSVPGQHLPAGNIGEEILSGSKHSQSIFNSIH